MVWSGANTTNAVWDSDTWDGRVRTEKANVVVASAKDTISETTATTKERPPITESVATSINSDSFSVATDISTTTASSTLLLQPTTQTQSIDTSIKITADASPIGTTSLAQSVDTSSLTGVSSSVTQNIGVAIAEPIIQLTGATADSTGATSSSTAIPVRSIVAAVTTKQSPIVTTAIIDSPVIVSQPITISKPDTISTVDDVSALSVVASSSILSTSLSSATTDVSISPSITSTTETILDGEGFTTAISDDNIDTAGVISATNITTESSRTLEDAKLGQSAASPFISDEIYAAIEEASITTASGSLIPPKIEIQITPDKIRPIQSTLLKADSVQVNSSLDLIESENETNFVELNESENEVIIEE